MRSDVLTQMLLGLGGGLLAPTDSGSLASGLSQGLLGAADAAAQAQAALPNPMDQKIKRAQLKSYKAETATTRQSNRALSRLKGQVPQLLNKMKATPGQRLAAQTAIASGDTAGLMDIIAPEAATPTTLQRDLVGAGYKPGSPAYKAAIRQSKGLDTGGGGGLLGNTEFSDLPESAKLAILTGKQPGTPAFQKSLLGFEDQSTAAPTAAEIAASHIPAGPERQQFWSDYGANMAGRDTSGKAGEPPEMTDVVIGGKTYKMPLTRALKQFGGMLPQEGDTPDKRTLSEAEIAARHLPPGERAAFWSDYGSEVAGRQPADQRTPTEAEIAA